MTYKLLILWFGTVFALSMLSRWDVFERRAQRCSLDGNRIAPVHRVDLMAEREVLASFCCVRCASEWPDVRDGSYWRVRDELTGEVLDANEACFVESGVVTVPSRQDHVHVFASWADALSHVAEFGGERIDQPLASRTFQGEPSDDESRKNE
ncbi:MAG: hypothetical protein E2O39_05145 [Planctomycetota bacterium]|nr:MAG: hypothetical protein E2O39_05145 [Planctomycetota bacterium]